MKKKGCMIGCLIIVIGILAAVGFIGFMIFGTNTYVTEDIAYYRALSGETDGPNSQAIFGEQIDILCPYELPHLETLEAYEDCRFNYMARRISFFESHAYILIVEYGESEYTQRKAALEKSYSWLKEEILGEEEGVSPEFALDGFDFRAVEGGYYPKEMFLVGTCDETGEFAYIYFYDQDLDYIGPDMPGFLLKETGWSKVAGK